jgi:hypothetical protein
MIEEVGLCNQRTCSKRNEAVFLGAIPREHSTVTQKDLLPTLSGAGTCLRIG